MKRSAVISDCGKYRYALHRKWGRGKMVMFIMLNPSTADGEVDDPTVRRCIAFAKSWGYGSLFIGNLFGFRATDPKELLTAENPIGELNAKWNETAKESAALVVCAWGNAPILNKLQKRFGKNYMPLSGFDCPLHYIELSKDGTPMHPLYLKGDLMPKKFEIVPNRILI